MLNRICLLACTLLLAATGSSGVPVMDGDRDADYLCVSQSPRDNLLVDVSKNINDPADPRSRSLDVEGLWAANSDTHLFLYIELPYLDLNTIAGEWAVLFHLTGASDGIGLPGPGHEPYGASADFAHNPAPNAVLKSNMRGFLNDFDGNQGWSFLNPVNKSMTDWDWQNSNYLASGGWTASTANGTITGTGGGGAGVVYKANKGIEVCFPVSRFAPNTGTTNVRPPSLGDTILMQFYANVRERGTPRYPRGVIDCVPFEPASRADPYRGVVSQWASYVFHSATPIDVLGVSLQDPTDPQRIIVRFSAALGAGANTTSNYTVTRVSDGSAVPVTSAQIDPTDATRAILTLPLPANTAIRVTVNNVYSASGGPVSALLNTDILYVPTPTVFRLTDPYLAVSTLGNDPATGQPYALTVTGTMVGWRTGPAEIPLTAVAGSPGTYESATVWISPGMTTYKYRVPGLGDYDNWNRLNPYDRCAVIPAAGAFTVTDTAAGTERNGGTAQVTFTLIDRDNVIAGRPVYVTGSPWSWDTSAVSSKRLLGVDGEPNTYRVSMYLPSTHKAGMVMQYRYIIKPTSDIVLMDALNPYGDRWATLTPGANSITDVEGDSQFTRALRAGAGLDPAPRWSDHFTALDANRDGVLSIMDTPRMPRIRVQNTRLTNARNEPFTLHGINLGGWLVEEMWMTPWVQDPGGTPYQRVEDHETLWSVLTQRLGLSAALNVRSAYRNAWIQVDDFRRIREAGFNHVRLPFIYDILDEPNGIDWLRRAVWNANAAGLYVVLDMHGAPGSQNEWDHSGRVGRNRFFYEEAHIVKAEQVWAALAGEFGSNPGVIAFDLLNEPAGAPDAATLHQVHNRLYQAIRAEAPNTMIIVEDGYKGFETMPALNQYGWSNVIYSTHLYNFDATSSQAHLDALEAQLPALLAVRNARNVPIYIGEFNLEPHNSPEVMVRYTRIMTDNQFGWAMWTYKTVKADGPMNFWGYCSNPTAITPLNPFTDSESTLISRANQARTENLTVPTGYPPVFRLP